MPTARKLPSGSWRVRIYTGKDEAGRKRYKSFTHHDPSPEGKIKCERLASDWQLNHGQIDEEIMTFGEAVDKYISARSAIWSAATIREYKRFRKSEVPELMETDISKISQSMIQRTVNQLAVRMSPRSVRNIHGNISAVLGVYRPDMRLRTDLPKLQPVERTIPTDAEVKKLIDTVAGTCMELPVLLAAFGPMRRGEICALEAKDIEGTVVHVCQNMVLDENKQWIVKSPKSYAGDRYIDYPEFVARKWAGITDGRIVPDLDPDDISHRFEHVLKRAKLPHFRFHDLRHYSASIQHAIGVPDAYIMQRGGWSSDGVLKSVYRHALKDKQSEESRKTNAYFSGLYDTKDDTNK